MTSAHNCSGEICQRHDDEQRQAVSCLNCCRRVPCMLPCISAGLAIWSDLALRQGLGIGGLGTEWAVATGPASCGLLLITCLDFGLADLGGGGAFGSTGSRFPRQKTFR